MKRALALLLALVLAGCAAEAEPVGDAPEEEPQAEAAEQVEEPRQERSGFSLAFEPGAGLNPYLCVSQTNRTALSLLYEPLFTVDSSFHAVPYLCESYSATGDGRTHTLTLRRGVTFSDGSELTAEDAVSSIRAAMGSPYYGQRLHSVTGLEARSERELVVTTGSAVGSLDALLNIYVVKRGTEENEIPLGTGPYVAGENSLRRIRWWRRMAPVVDETTIRLVAVETPAAVRDSFEYGMVDLVCTDPNAGARLAFHSDFELWDNATTMMQYIAFNLNSPVFSYAPLRRAVGFGIDRDAIVSGSAAGFATAAVLPASPYAAFYSRQLAEEYGLNDEAFRRELDERSVSDITGEDGILEFYTQTGVQPLKGVMLVCRDSEQRVEAAQAAAGSLNERGFDLTVRALDHEKLLDALQKGEFDLYYGEVRLTPDFDLTAFFLDGGSLSFGSIADASAAQLCVKAVENEGNAYDLHREILERGLICPVLFKVCAIYTARGRISGLTPCLDGVFLRPMEAG